MAGCQSEGALPSLIFGIFCLYVFMSLYLLRRRICSHLYPEYGTTPLFPYCMYFFTVLLWTRFMRVT
ncbi:hypothetical protein QBC38DRAFT_278045 [Podospora fimiseda]|uniref:Uncharacterized protein n=1 Tax=Podospora fimiseda TaxID=252190 RepID=A0AAN7BWM6_9PEZI|nr:hypothetical protein QBC38DRAFT_278045 [Podospora fimiseda]